MNTISIEQLESVTGGTQPLTSHYVTSKRNPVAIEAANLNSKTGTLTIYQRDRSSVTLHKSPKGTWMR